MHAYMHLAFKELKGGGRVFNGMCISNQWLSHVISCRSFMLSILLSNLIASGVSGVEHVKF